MYRFFDWIIEAIGWLRIFASPFLIGLGIGATIYLSNPTATNFIIGCSFVALGAIIGTLWATNIWNSENGTMWFLSRVMATPDLDKKESNDNKTKNNS